MCTRDRVIGFAICVLATLWSPCCFSEEPYEKFLNRLKEERLFDLALAYLDQLEAKKDLPPLFAAGLELERGMLKYQDAALMLPSNPARARALDEAEAALRDFLKTRRNHPRRGEGRLKLGELLLQRADEAKRQNPDTTKDNQEAIAFYDSAHKLFEETIQELAGILDRIKGARTDPNDKRAIAYRSRVQGDVRSAQLFSAKAIEERGRSRAESSRQRKADLEQAAKMFTDLYLKEQKLVGIRNYALFYRSEIQRDLGLVADATDGFQRVADQEGVDELRPLQTSAIQELVKLFVAQEKYPLAVGRADKWIAKLRPNEGNFQETIDLKLELAKTKIAWSKALKKQDAEDRVAGRLVRDTRTELRSLLRIQGEHLEETRQLLADLGVGASQEEDESVLPEVDTFAEATTEAQKRIDASETDSLGLAILREQGKQAELQALEAQVSQKRQQSISLLQQALQLFSGEEDKLEELYQARFSLSYLYLREQEPWDALSIAQFVSKKNPRTQVGLKAAAVALGAFSDLLRTAEDKDRAQMTALLEPYAKFLVATWPDSTEASAASAALVQLALANQQWDKVDEYLALAPTEGDAIITLRRDAGVSLFNRYIDVKSQDGENSPQAKRLVQQAQQSLEIATKDLSSDKLDDSFANAVNALSRLYLMQGALGPAEQILLQGKASPIRLIEKSPERLSGGVAMNSYRSAIQLVIGKLAAGKLASGEAVQQSKSYIAAMQKLAAKLPNGQKTLASIFYSLAKDLKGQLGEAKQPDQRRRLSEATIMLAKQAAAADDFNTKYWGVDTILSIAEELNSDRNMRAISKDAFAQASSVLQEIMAAQQADANYIDPPEREVEVQLQLAKSYRGTGSYRSAIDAFEKILLDNNTLLTVQIEAARTYQAWGDAEKAGYHKVAVLGGRLNQATGKKTIWGWGRMSQLLQGDARFESQFYLSRYELARSRYQYGISLQGQKKTDELAAAKKAVVITATLYPELGGDTQRKKFDALMRAIQGKLGEPKTGLAAINAKK